jgi:hypothetical protein
MTYAVPMVDLEDVQLKAVRAGARELGAIQVVNHGVSADLTRDHVKDRVADDLAAYGRPEQIAAWRDGTPYVAELAENSAGR